MVTNIDKYGMPNPIVTQGMLVGYTSDLSLLNSFERDLIILAFREIQFGDYFLNPSRARINDVLAWRVEDGSIIGLHIRHLTTLPKFLVELPKVRELIIFGEDLDLFPSFPLVSRLVIVNMGLGVRTVDWGVQPALTMLQLIGYEPPKNKNLGTLEILSLRRLNFNRLADRIKKTRLRRLELSNVTGDITPVLDIKTLEDLEVFIADISIDLRNLANLHQLKTLILFDVGLKSIPNSIGQLKNLEYLDLGKNHLEVLPSSLGNLCSLKILKVRGNRLKSLPSTLGKLSHLIEIDFRENLINVVPPFFSKLPNLFRLQFEQINVENLPPLNLNHLVYLSFFECNGKTLPPDIWTASNLATLLIWQTPIEILPSSIKQLRGLRWLFLKETKICSLPKEIDSLINLEKLNIEHCPLKQLPSELKNLKNLEFISIHSLDLESFPEGVVTLPKIQRIELYVSRLCKIPDDILENPRGITVYIKRD